jgi:TerC family integral membrane protein
MESERIFLWIAFNVFVLGMLALDLGVFHRKAHAVTIKEASVWSVVWIALAMLFNLGIYFAWGQDKALEFLTGYVIEKSLSVDNLFVFLMIFQYFATPSQYQHRVLFWGILGALILRAIFIATGSALLSNFHWMMYVFGAFLVITGIKMYFQGDEKIEPERNPVVRLFERWVPISKKYDGQKFFIRRDGKTHATLLMLVLIVVETTDVIFAVDSIPAIFAITQDPFIVYTSNVFAILGLRALYFMLAGVMEMFVYLKVGLSVVLCFVGAKMMLVDIYKIPIGASLGVIGGVLVLSILASWIFQPQTARAHSQPSHVGSPSNRARASAFANPTVIGWIAAFLIAAVLILVKWDSIARGPTSKEAITVIGVIERDLAEAKWLHARSHEALLIEAGMTLEQARKSLSNKSYQQAIEIAQEAGKLLEDLPRRN